MFYLGGLIYFIGAIFYYIFSSGDKQIWAGGYTELTQIDNDDDDNEEQMESVDS